MKISKLIVSSLVFMASISTFAQQPLTVADITTNNRFKTASVKFGEILDDKETTEERYTLTNDNIKYIYRRSYTAEYTIKENATGKTASIKGEIKIPMFSPDNKFLAFVRDNNIFLVDIEALLSGKSYEECETAVTTDGEHNKIINGHAD